MRMYPPIIVSAAASAVLFIASFVTITDGARVKAVEAAERQEIYSVPDECVETERATEAQSTSMIMSRDWGSDDGERLLKIAMAEAEGESVEGKALVMLVVLNRVWSSDFPETIEEVIFQPTQFSTVEEGGRYYTTEPNEECYEALELVMSGWDESCGALYFESCAGSSWHSENLEYLFQVGGHRFYR